MELLFLLLFVGDVGGEIATLFRLLSVLSIFTREAKSLERIFPQLLFDNSDKFLLQQSSFRNSVSLVTSSVIFLILIKFK